MLTRSVLCVGIIALISSAANAQPDAPKKAPPEPIPAELVVHDIREAYSRLVADEVTIRFRGPSGDRTDSLTVRLDPGEAADPHPRAAFLELGSLRIHIAAGKLTAISTAAPDKFYQRDFPGPITPARLSDLLPPLPLPQLALISGDQAFSAPLNHLKGVTWAAGIPDESARPATITMHGTAPTGSIDIISNLATGRLIKVSATLQRPQTEATLELICKPADPGDPAKWAISTEGRQAVAALSDLRTTPRPMGALAPGQPVPNISLSHFDMSPWTLHEAMDAIKPGESWALLLFRSPADHDKAQAAFRDARTGLAVLRVLHQGRALPDDPPGVAPPPKFSSACAIVIELAEFSRDRWTEARNGWGLIARGRQSPAATSAIGADDIMWSPGMVESIGRFDPEASAVIVVIRPDHTLAATIKLDGRYTNASEIGVEVRRALMPSAAPAAPPPSPASTPESK